MGAKSTTWALGASLVVTVLWACSVAGNPPIPTLTPVPTEVATTTLTPAQIPTPLVFTVTPLPSPTPTPEQGDVLFRYSFAVRLLESKQFEDAIPHLDIVIRVMPEFSQAYHYRGLAFYNNDQKHFALEDFNKAILLDPDFAIAYRNRGILHFSEGSLNQGVADLQKALVLYDAAGDMVKADDVRRMLADALR